MEHRGTAATTFALQARFFWPKLKNDVQKFVSARTKCQTNKINRKKPAGEFKSYSNQPDQDNPTAWIFSQICHHLAQKNTTHYGWSSTDSICGNTLYAPGNIAPPNYALSNFSNISYATSAMAIGMPREIISDCDTIFTAKFWCHLMKRCGTAIRLSSARSQQTNGLAERTIAIVEECLRNSITYK